ncbi:hypothetical protein CP083_04100 [Candidatus Bathyarchaeota archaeon B24-2]|nr:MAG: hypothetical protein CP083_04100 [Candidatus Bathyarchaeota archaeon B24-2]
MKTATVSEELKKRVPRFIVNLAALALVTFVYNTVPLPFGILLLPGLNISVDQLIRLVIILAILVLLARTLPDAFFLADVTADTLLKRLGMKDEEKPLRRAARDFVYIIVTVLMATAVLPFLTAIPSYGHQMATAASLIALGAVLLLIYDIGRVVYGVLERKAEVIANRLLKRSEKGE